MPNLQTKAIRPAPLQSLSSKWRQSPFSVSLQNLTLSRTSGKGWGIHPIKFAFLRIAYAPHPLHNSLGSMKAGLKYLSFFFFFLSHLPRVCRPKNREPPQRKHKNGAHKGSSALWLLCSQIAVVLLKKGLNKYCSRSLSISKWPWSWLLGSELSGVCI